MDVLNAEGWIDRAVEFINEDWRRSASGRTAQQTTDQRRTILGLPAGTFNTRFMIDDRWLQPGHPGLTFVDWQDELFRKGFLQNYQLSASGGNEFVKYFVSGDYLDQDGIAHGVTYKRYSARANVEVQASNQIKFGINISPSYTDANDPGVDGKDLQSHIAVSLVPIVEEAAGSKNRGRTFSTVCVGRHSDQPFRNRETTGWPFQTFPNAWHPVR